MKPKVLLIGQTPPPFHGQAMMIEALVKGPMPHIELRHLRLAYSGSISEVGRLRVRKFFSLVGVVARALWSLVTFRPDVVYYPPAGPQLVPVVRDIVTLLAIRSFPVRLVFHFHAGGLSELYRDRIIGQWWEGWFRQAFFGADAAIVLSSRNPPDGSALEAREVDIVPYGIADRAAGWEPVRPASADPPEVLFVGAVTEEKGVRILLEAAAQLWRTGLSFRVRLVGEASAEIATRIAGLPKSERDRIEMSGVLTGDEKWAAFRRADVFCFPTFYRAETFGVVCLEAMMFGLPVIASRWRGIPDIVDDGVTGALVEPKDPIQLADALRRLLVDPAARERLGRAARARFLERFTADRYLSAVEQVFLRVAGGPKRR